MRPTRLMQMTITSIMIALMLVSVIPVEVLSASSAEPTIELADIGKDGISSALDDPVCDEESLCFECALCVGAACWLGPAGIIAWCTLFPYTCVGCAGICYECIFGEQ